MKHFDLILCPVDFSDNSFHAIEQASFLAQMLQADLTLVHVIRNVLPESLGVVKGMDLASQKMVEQATTQARDLLREAKQKYVPYSVTCKSSVRYGDISEGILAEAKDRKANLIFMATEGGEGLSILGNIPRNVMAGASCPVLTYHHTEERKGFRKILIPMPEGGDVAPIRTYVKSVFALTGPEIVLLTILDPEASQDDHAAALQHLAEECSYFRDQGLVDVRGELSHAKDPVQGISDFAQQHDFHLIMLNGFEAHDAPGKGINQLAGQLGDSLRMPMLTFNAQNGQSAGSPG